MELIKLFLGILMLICLMFSINLNNINNAIEEIIPTENPTKINYFGLYLQDFKGKVRVADVVEYTPAKAAGIEVGDRILEINGIKIRTVNSFYENIKKINNKQTIKLIVYRVDSCSTFPVEINNTVVCNNIKNIKFYIDFMLYYCYKSTGTLCI